MIIKNQPIQLLYDTLFSAASAAVSTGIVALIGDRSFEWVIFLSVLLSVFLLLCIENIVISKYVVDDEDTEQEDSYIEDPIYSYDDYSNGYAMVKRICYTDPKHKTAEVAISFIDKSGEFITDKWYPGATDFDECGVAVVFDGERYNIINGTGRELSPFWFDGMTPFADGMAKVYDSETDCINFINTRGELLWKEWKRDF